jgi:hypothetical protein
MIPSPGCLSTRAARPEPERLVGDVVEEAAGVDVVPGVGRQFAPEAGTSVESGRPLVWCSS